MNSESLPQYSDIFPSSSVPRVMDLLLSHPHSYSPKRWCQILITTATTESPSIAYVVTEIRHFKEKWQNLEHEYLILLVQRHATSAHPQALPGNEKRYHIQVSRTIDDDPAVLAIFGVRGRAVDDITVLEQCPQPTHYCLTTVSWQPSVAPDLIKVSKIFDYITSSYPCYTLPSTSCCFLARTAYDVITAVYSEYDVEPRRSRKLKKRSRFLLAFSAGVAKSTTLSNIIIAVLSTMERHERAQVTVGAQGSGAAASRLESVANRAAEVMEQWLERHQQDGISEEARHEQDWIPRHEVEVSEEA
ncbi:hypothetical protein BDN67DRAFT_978317 [Paxillus ammoniavirescens]|nr:hypothetical protein BDN67DRAFT_978317 [Paxillus ammoniavirescens]